MVAETMFWNEEKLTTITEKNNNNKSTLCAAKEFV